MPISPILTPFDHFHFRPALAVKCIHDLRICLMKKEQVCKMEEQVEFGRGGSKDKIFAMEGDEESLRQDSDEDISTMESKSKQKDFGLENGIVVKSYQPLALLLNRAPRYTLTIFI